MGVGEHESQLYIIDFGLAKQYRDPKTHLHIPFRRNCDLTGTAPYASINNHQGVETSRRDDLESLAYVLLYFLRGSLPWYSAGPTIKKRQHSTILKMKNVSPDVLCSSFPEEFSTFLSYSRTLRFEDKPDYAYIRQLFRDLFIREGYQYGHPFAGCVICDDKSAAVRAGNQKILQRSATSDRMFVSSTDTTILQANLLI